MKDKKVITSKKWYNSANYSHLLGKICVYNGIECQITGIPQMLNDYYTITPLKVGDKIGNLLGQSVCVPESEFENKVTLIP